VNNLAKNIGVWLVIGIVLMMIFVTMNNRNTRAEQMDYSTLMSEAKSGNISSVKQEGSRTLRVTTKDSKTFLSYIPGGDIYMWEDLRKSGAKIEAKEEESRSLILEILISSFPVLLLIGVWIYFMRQMQGGGRGGAFSFGKSRARMLDENTNPITFADVAGCDEAKEEVSEIVDFLRDPSKFQKLGGRIPRGVLMVGSPGTGKTLIARAIAGEAKVPFFSISGSDFVEMFVGVGAARVRDMFEQAKKSSPCIIFIDEIDAVGRQRGAGLGGGNDEREQTLNQLLVEMDGFEATAGVIVIAATNRPDVLDPALLRPGRFDRQVVVPLPDIRGREQILLVHMRKVPIAPDVEPSVIARGTPGYSGADLANLVNEAALFAARVNKRLVEMDDFEKAKDKINMGAERKSQVMTEKDKLETAYHEAGHAVVGALMPKHDPLHKVTIIPRGRALGVTFFLPEQDRYSYDREYLECNICMALGGRIAEEIFCGMMTSGASQDIKQATSMARRMVTEWGMSEKLGMISYSEAEQEVFLGKSWSSSGRAHSEATQQRVDAEVERIIETQYKRAREILETNRDKVEAMVKALMEFETIDSEQIKDIMGGRPPRPPKPSSTPAKPRSGGDGNTGSAGGVPVTAAAPVVPPVAPTNTPEPTAKTAEDPQP
jgi:cell division protease FtsH